MSQTGCFHCGEPIPPGFHGELAIQDTPRHFCCIGCMAIAEMLVSNKLDNFYQHRTQLSQKPDPMSSAQEAELRLYDDEELQSDFVEVTPHGERIAALNIQGITCAACIWLLEREINRLPGVISFSVNHTSHKARLHWQPDQKQAQMQEPEQKLSTVLLQIVRLGFKAFPYQEDRVRKAAHQERRRSIFRIALAGIAMMQSMMFSVPLYLSGYSNVDVEFIELFRWVSMLVCIPVVLLSAAPFYQAAWRDLKTRHMTMDVPVALAILLAFFASSYITLFIEKSVGMDVYFDSIAMFIFLLLLGRFFELQTRQKYLNSDAEMQQLLPVTAVLQEAGLHEQLQERTVPAHKIKAGDRVIVRQGQIAPVDGIVISGQSRFDESALTGEYLPILKAPGSPIHAGTANTENTIVLEASGPVSQSRVAAIVRLIDQAQAEKPKTVEMANLVASHFISIVLVSTALSGVYWWLHEPDKVLVIMVAVLIATCPCALSLATPTAITATNIALRNIGFLVTRGHSLEAMSTTTDVIFDKTGTLSEARLEVVKVCTLGDMDETTVLEITAALEAESNHPIASAFKSFFKHPAEQVTNIAGSGLSGLYQGHTWHLGTLDFVRKNGQSLTIAPSEHTGVLVWLSDETRVLAQIQLNDQLRSSAPECIQHLRQLGMTVHILSGDHRAAVEQTARTLNIENFRYAQSPEQKLTYVKQLEQKGRKVAMVGDGINDLPVLSGAQLSIAMGNASDLAKLNSDAILLNSHLDVLAQAFQSARRSRRIIRQNIVWSALYNFSMIPLAAVGLVPPFVAAVGMSTSSLLVLFNSLRLRKIQQL